MAYPDPNDVRAGVVFGAADEQTGTLILPAAVDVRTGITYGKDFGEGSFEFTGVCWVPVPGNVRSGFLTDSDGTDGLPGTLTLPDITDVTNGTTYGAAGTEFTGNLVLDYPAEDNVRFSIVYNNGANTGNLGLPAIINVRVGTGYGAGGGEFTGICYVPNPGNVHVGELTDTDGAAGLPGTLTTPAIGQVISGVSYGAEGTEFVGTLVLPGVGDVRSGIEYGAGGTADTGTLVLPLITNVLDGIGYGTGGVEFVGNFIPETIPEETLTLPLTDTLNVTTGTLFAKTFVATAVVLPNDWSFATFIVKADRKTDSDENALLIVRVSNPAAVGTDGLLRRNGYAVASADALRLKAAIAMVAVTPDATIAITLDSAALLIPPTPENETYDYQILVWNAAGEKIVFASGDFIAARCLRRAVAAP